MGIPVRIHYTLWLVFILITWSLAVGYMPHQYPGLSTITYWGIGIASAIILFASVLIHELSHSYIAKKNGLPIARITLFFFGGVSEMSEEPQDPLLEVKMAAAGPLMSFLIAGVLAGAWYASKTLNFPVSIVATVGYGALINAILGAFNLLPAFPLDGGRVLRGSLWKHYHDLIRATRMATRISEIISLLMMFGGFATIIFGDFIDGIWIVVLGWFIKSGAETSLSATLVGETLSGVMVNDIMTRNVLTVPPDILVEQLIADYLLVHRHGGYPVVKNGKMMGLVTMQSVRSVPKELRSVKRVEEIMVPIERVVTVNPTLSALDAMQRMGKARIGRLLVVEGDQLLGIVTSGDIMRTAHMRQELGVRGEQRWTPPTTIPATQMKHCIQCGGGLTAGINFCPHCGSKQPE